MAETTTRRGKGQPQPLNASALAQRAAKEGGPHFHISHVIKSVDGDNVVDHSLADILARGSGREDVREPDTPVTSGQPKARPKQSFPTFNKGQGGGRPSGLDPGLIQFTADSIITPHTYARFHTEPHSKTPQSSELGYKVFHYLRKNWQSQAQTFAHYNNQRELRAFGQEIISLCQEVSPIFEAEPMYLTLPANIFVIGDVHGNFGDLHYFFNELVLFKDISLTPHSFLCLGDYVDRGQFSLECVLYCLSLKAQSPDTFFMLRGNHEDPGINGDVDTYGNDCFQSQCRNVFGDEQGMEIWHAVNGVFRTLPMAASIEGKIFCSHGGIPRYFGPPDQDDRLRLLLDPQFPRFRSLFEPLDLSVVSKELMERFWVLAFDLMWSDPSEGDSELNEYGFGRNDRGNCIITFGEVAVDRFLQTHHMELMFRAHQEKSDGLKLSKSAKCLTVFSSSNYQGHGNGAGVVFVSADGRVRLIMKEPSRE